jgi:hypothetical protein
MLGAMDISSVFDASLSSVNSVFAAKVATVSYKFEVTVGSLGLHSFPWPGWGVGHWGQPWNQADGDYTIADDYAESWVSVRSWDMPGGACNTVDRPDPSGSITLYMKSPIPRSVETLVFVNMDLSSTGPMGRAHGNIIDGDDVRLRNQADVYGNDAQHFTFIKYSDTYVGTSWTKVLKYTPVISFPKDNGKRNTGYAKGSVYLSSYRWGR